VRVVVADDEAIIRRGLRRLLGRQHDLAVVGEAANGRQAVAAIRELQPDAVFLDVQMPAGDGFWVVSEVGAAQMPLVVFVTAHDQYAVGAFGIDAVDYLLKPFDPERLAASVERLRTRLRARAAPMGAGPTGDEPEMSAGASRWAERLAVRSAGQIDYLAVDDVDWIEAADNYVVLHCGARTYVELGSLRALGRRLDPDRFVRIHRSRIVNVSRVRRMRPLDHGDYELLLEGGALLRSSRRHHGALRRLADRT
jgi:two-component system LytT family response regulator